jgi:hypothetical protein
MSHCGACCTKPGFISTLIYLGESGVQSQVHDVYVMGSPRVLHWDTNTMVNSIDLINQAPEVSISGYTIANVYSNKITGDQAMGTLRVKISRYLENQADHLPASPFREPRVR